jgi:tRNA(Arg) A34 adenosine deaminase TadA
MTADKRDRNRIRHFASESEKLSRDRFRSSHRQPEGTCVLDPLHSGSECTCHRPTRRFVLAGLACTTLAPQAFAADKAPPSSQDERFMRIAIEEARRADFPFGAVIVRDGKVIARGRNLGASQRDPTAHSEMVAIRRAIASPGSEALKGSTIYTSGEPCPMCMGAMLWCGMGRLVFAASMDQIASVVDQPLITSAELASRARFAPIEITGGVLADEAMAVLKKKG